MRKRKVAGIMKTKLDRAVISLARGDNNALSTIYNLAARLIFSTAYAITANYQDSEDVLQDTFLEISKYADRFTGKGAKSWILTMTRHLAIDVVRKRRQSSLENFADSPQFAYRDDYSDLEVFDLLNQLTEEERQIVTYRVYAKMSHKEIAQIMEITLANSQKKYQRAIQKLRKEYSHENTKHKENIRSVGFDSAPR
jgi:RNA polymerase sigma-70 factor (ECF subfamily)